MKNFTVLKSSYKSQQITRKKNHSCLFLLILILFTGIIRSHVYAEVIGVDPNSVFYPGSATIGVYNENNWSSVSPPVALTMAGFTVTGAQSVTWNSNNLLFYAIVRVSSGARHLATVDPQSGICTNIGALSSPSFSTLTFNSDLGILYAMGGSGGPPGVAECLFSVNMNTAATTFLAGPFPVGTFGEVIAYNYDDDMIYHWSGDNPANMEKINPVTFASTPVTQTGDVHEEIQGAVYVGSGVFVATDLVFQTSTSGFTITSTGVVDFIAPTPSHIRGLGYVDPVLPVELSSLVSLVNGNEVILNWSTTSETNNSGFDIERSNVRGQASNEWINIGNVTGNGTSSVQNSYSFTDKNLASGNYNYRLKQIDFNGNFEYFNLSNEVNVGIPAKFELSQNYPNPFNPTTKIEYQLPNDGNVNISVFDNSGKEVASLVNEFKSAGYYTVNFNGASLSSGVYFYKIASGNFSSVKKMMLVK